MYLNRFNMANKICTRVHIAVCIILNTKTTKINQIDFFESASCLYQLEKSKTIDMQIFNTLSIILPITDTSFE